MDSEPSQNALSTSPTSAAPQVRSRITVVCAECKRLKLKCDRRNPCGSCVKRDTTARCIYSPAAAEKVDLHSLNNRLIQVEGLLAQLTSGQFTSSFPASNGWPPPPPPNGGIPAPSTSTAQPSLTPLPYTSLALSLDDVAHIWLDHLDVSTRICLQGSTTEASSLSGVKLEASSASASVLSDLTVNSLSKSLPPTSIYYLAPPQNMPFSTPPTDTQYKPTVTQSLLDLLPPSVSTLLGHAEQSVYHSYPSINWKQFRSRASRMMATSFRTMPFSDSLNNRDKAKNRNRRDTVTYPRSGNPLPPFTPSNALPAQDGSDPCVKVEGVPFFGAVCAALALGALESSREMPTSTGDAMLVDSYPPSGSSARGASSGMYLDAEYWYRLSVQALAEYERGLTLNVKTKAKVAEEYGLDYLVACLFQVIFLMKGGLGPVSLDTTDTYLGYAADAATSHRRRKDRDRDRPNDKARNFNGVAAVVFPLVGKMVNIARKMGLGKDPHEIPLPVIDVSGSAKKPKSKSEMAPSQTRAVSNLFDAEMRRRVWWDVLYYDVFVSDALGHEPLISDDFSTKLPAGDVDEKVFSTVSTRIPISQALENGAEYSRDAFQYFNIKCRLALLVRTIQRRMCASELSTSLFNYGNATSFASKNGYGYSIDQAASMEAEVTRWVDELPSCYRLEKSTIDLSATDPILASQKCEVVITAQRLILKVYMPFLRKHATVSETVPAPHQATFGSVNAAHLIIRACGLLNSVWKGHGQEDRPAPSALSSALYDLYPLTRILFDAAIVCAHASIKQTMPMMASAAEEALDLAVNVLKDQRYWSKMGGSKGMGSAHAVSVPEALDLLLELKQQAMNARGLMGPSLKRKHAVVEEEDGVDSDDGERDAQDDEVVCPFSQERARQSSPVFDDLLPPSSEASMTPTCQSPTQTFPADHNSYSGYNTSSYSKEQKSKKAKKPQSYPAIGIRVRTGKEGSPLTCRRLSPPTPSSTEQPAQPPSDSSLGAMSQQYHSSHPSPLHIHHEQNPSSAVPSPMHMPLIESERYRSRSSSLSQANEVNGYSRRDSATDIPYPRFPSSDSPRPDVPRRYTVSQYSAGLSSQPPLVTTSQSQPLPGTYGVASQSTAIYDRASSYESPGGYVASSTEGYVPAQSPYPSSSPYATTSGPLSSAGSPYTNSSTNTTPTYPSPQAQSIPVVAPAPSYYSYEAPAPAVPTYSTSPFTSTTPNSYPQESMSDVKPSVDRYPQQQQQTQLYPQQGQWQAQAQAQAAQQPQQYWTSESTANYYPPQ